MFPRGEHDADGGRAAGPFVNGKMEGRWAMRSRDGRVEEGPYVNGKREGWWVIRLPEGTRAAGPYVNGKMEGRWAMRSRDGDICGFVVFVDGHEADKGAHDCGLSRGGNGAVDAFESL